MSEQNPLLTTIDERGVARLTLNRPEVHNAFGDSLIADLNQCPDRAGQQSRRSRAGVGLQRQKLLRRC